MEVEGIKADRIENKIINKSQTFLKFYLNIKLYNNKKVLVTKLINFCRHQFPFKSIITFTCLVYANIELYTNFERIVSNHVWKLLKFFIVDSLVVQCLIILTHIIMKHMTLVFTLIYFISYNSFHNNRLELCCDWKKVTLILKRLIAQRGYFSSNSAA